MSLPPYIERATIHKRLQKIFPEGVPQRNYCIREAAASTIFAMLYIGAVEGADKWLGPKQIYRMTDNQAARQLDTDRLAYAKISLKPGYEPEEKSWYRDNSREQIRDETIRQGLIPNNAALERPVPTTSPLPRYALKIDFAKLFEPSLSEKDFEKAAETWLEQHLSVTALARTVLMRRGATTTGEGILVTFPNDETRRMVHGPSSIITKAVIEEFAKRYLLNPAVLWVSESGAKVVSRDDELAAQLKLRISADRNLPDIILVDLGDGEDGHLLLVFIEVVATDGPVTPQRQEALLKIATAAGFPPKRVAFVTAYLDRSHPAFKKTISELAWRSFAWFAAEPEHLIVLHDGHEEIARSLAQLM